MYGRYGTLFSCVEVVNARAADSMQRFITIYIQDCTMKNILSTYYQIFKQVVWKAIRKSK
jgi:hypothetical protein